MWTGLDWLRIGFNGALTNTVIKLGCINRKEFLG
jgi:hypothetical protein